MKGFSSRTPNHPASLKAPLRSVAPARASGGSTEIEWGPPPGGLLGFVSKRVLLCPANRAFEAHGLAFELKEREVTLIAPAGLQEDCAKAFARFRPLKSTPFKLPLSATDGYLGLFELPLVPVVSISCQHSVRYEPIDRLL